MLGFELPLNFRLPFFAKNPSDLWERWHITLSSWLRDYLYISLGGNRKGASWTYFNLMATMVLGGLWHGANDNFIAWGFYHGLVLVVYRWLAHRGMSWPKENTTLVLWLRRLVMFHLWCVGCTIFRATTTEHALRIITEIFAFTPANVAVASVGFAYERLLFFAGPLLLFQWFQFRSGDLNIIFKWPWFVRGFIYAVLVVWMIVLRIFMVKSSTISSFKAWWSPAAGLALVLVLLAEFVLAPLTPPEHIFAFDQNNYERPGRQDYEALRVLLTYPQKPADIAIMGSSRPRDGILAPLLAAQLKLNFGRSVDVVNYAAVGFRAFDFEVLAQRLIADPRVTPKVVVLPINPRFLQEEGERDNLRFSLMGLDQVGHELKTHGLSAPLHLVETILSNGVANLYALRLAAREWWGLRRFQTPRIEPDFRRASKTSNPRRRLASGQQGFDLVGEHPGRGRAIGGVRQRRVARGRPAFGRSRDFRFRADFASFARGGRARDLNGFAHERRPSSGHSPGRPPGLPSVPPRNGRPRQHQLHRDGSVPSFSRPRFPGTKSPESIRSDQTDPICVGGFDPIPRRPGPVAPRCASNLMGSEMPSLRFEEAFETGHGAGQAHAGVAAARPRQRR